MTELPQRSLLARRGARTDAERQLISSLARRRRRGGAKHARSRLNCFNFFFRLSTNLNLKTGEKFPRYRSPPLRNQEKRGRKSMDQETRIIKEFMALIALQT